MARLDYKKLNSTLRYLMFSVFTVTPGELGEDRAAVAADLEGFLARFDGTDVVVRGLYDVSGLRAEADFMIWTHAEHIEDLQTFYNDFRRGTLLGRASTAYWSNTALHRPAEFNKSHIPAFLAEEEPGAYISVYPFVRSYEWYLLPGEEPPSTAARPASTRTSGPTPCRRSRWATTSGCWPSRPPSSTGSWTSCASCAAPRPAATCARRSRSSPGPASPPSGWPPRCPDPRAGSARQSSAGSRVMLRELMQYRRSVGVG